MQCGNTALMWATEKNNPQIAKILLEHKADPDLKKLADVQIIAGSNIDGLIPQPGFIRRLAVVGK